jgi:hypothetical protein
MISMMSMSIYLIESTTLLIVPRFGNYIGDAESDEEHHEDAQPQAFKFDEAFNDEEEEEINDQQLMEVDGMSM